MDEDNMTAHLLCCKSLAKQYGVYLVLSSFQETIDPSMVSIPKYSELSFIIDRLGDIGLIKRKSQSLMPFELKVLNGDSYKSLFLICGDAILTPNDGISDVDIILHPVNIDEAALLGEYAKYKSRKNYSMSVFELSACEASLFYRFYNDWPTVLSKTAHIFGSDSYRGSHFAFKATEGKYYASRPDLETISRYETGTIDDKFNFLVIDVKK